MASSENRPNAAVAQPVSPARPIPVATDSGAAPPQAVPQPARPIAAAAPAQPGQAVVAATPVATGQAGGANATRAARPVPVAARPIPVPASSTALVRADEDLEETHEVTEAAIRSAPPWLVSAVLHMVLLIIFGLWYFASNREQQVDIEVVYSDELGEQLLNDDLTSVDIEMPDINEAELSYDDIMVMDPFAAPPELDLAVDANTITSDLAAPSIGLALTGREKGAKKALLAAYGGTGQTEAAVALGLEWLARQQNTRSGTWSLTGPYSDGGGQENQLAATAMALLAFQGAGNTHQSGKYERNVSRGMEALVAMQDDDGNFWDTGNAHHRLYSQAQATIALCELYGMTKDSRYRAPAQKALDYAARIQDPELGGWRYYPGDDSDTSVTGWFVMALQSGLMAGLDVQSPTLDAVGKFLDRMTDEGVLYKYQRNREPTLTMTAEGLLCRQYLGWEHEDPRIVEGIQYLLKNPVNYETDENVYYWYYATQVLHHMGGDAWDQWNDIMRVRVPARQVKQGKERGSWDPGGDRWGAHGGRLFTTCLSIYNLEVYYRHLPIYQH